MKSKSSVINGLVDSAMDIVEMKIDYLRLVAEQFREKGETSRADHWEKQAKELECAVSVIRSNSGGWF